MNVRKKSLVSRQSLPCGWCLILMLLAPPSFGTVELPPAGHWTGLAEHSLGRNQDLREVRAVGLGQDRFLLVWLREWGTQQLVAQVMDANAQLVGGAFVVADFPSEEAPHDLVAAPDGGVFFVGWEVDIFSGTHHVWARRLAADGLTLGPPRRVDEQGSHAMTFPTVAVAPDGRALVFWHTKPSAQFGHLELRGRWLDAAGVPESHELAGPPLPDPAYPHLAASPGGGFLLTAYGGSQRQRLDAAGQAVGEYELAPPEVGAEFRLLGTPAGVFGSYAAVLGMSCGSDPTCVVPETSVGRLDTVPPAQTWISQFGQEPEIAVHPTGAVFVAWEEPWPLLEGRGRWLAPDGTASTAPERLVGGDVDLATARNGRGDILLAWAGAATESGASGQTRLSAKVLQVDTDGDGFFDAEDVCPNVADPSQSDADLDRLGTACDCDDADPANHALCLGPTGRFRVQVGWVAASLNGPGHPLPLTPDTGAFWFFEARNLELMVKVLDGCAVGGHYWVFAAGLTNVETTLTVTDRSTGAAVTYRSSAGPPYPPIQDTSAFPCE